MTTTLDKIDWEQYRLVPAIYLRIVNAVVFAIISEKVDKGDRLPSVLELSKILQINHCTVAKAYRNLKEIGFIVTRPGMGTFIAISRKDLTENVG